MSSLFINGKWQEGHGSVFTSTNPATQEAVWQGTSADPSDVDKTIDHAHKAFLNWSRVSFDERVKILKTFAELLKDNQEELASTISIENGKPLWEAKTEINAMAAKINISIEAHQNRCQELIKDMPGKTSITRFKPHGVVVVFGPFNFPCHLANGHIVPALLAGNTIVFKPSELTPLVAQKTVALWQQAGLPDGVLNLLQGGADTGKSLIENKQIRGVFFTGSSQVGKILSQSLASRPEVMLALEMGGNNPLIVSKVSDIAAASYTIIQSAYITAGQRCTCSRRLIIPKSSEADTLIQKIVEDINHLRVGIYTDTPEPFMGPVIHEQAAQNVLSKQQEWQGQGAHVLLGCEQRGPALLTPGLIDTTNITREDKEVFGPLLQVIRVEDFQEALAEANNTKYGLAAGLLSDDANLYQEFSSQIQAGIVNWNQPLTGASSSAPFGGIGDSGNHRPSAYFAADYCSYAVASLESQGLSLPSKLVTGWT